MRRSSIAKLMLLIGFLAANFAAVRALISPEANPRILQELLCGLIPMADVLLLSLYVVASRYRVAVRRRGERGHFPLYCLAFCGVCLGAAVVASFLAPGMLSEYLEAVGPPIDRRLRSIGVDTNTDTPLLRYVLLPGLLGVLLSGPPLLASVSLAAVLARFKIVVIPRAEEPCVASASGG